MFVEDRCVFVGTAMDRQKHQYDVLGRESPFLIANLGV